MRAAGALVLLAASGCFYLDTVNVPPVARIMRPAGPYHVGDTVLLSAVASTDDDAPAALAFDWSAACAGCAAQSGSEEAFPVHIASHDPVRVTVVVFDRHGASGTATVDLDVTDRAPTLSAAPVQLPTTQGTYPVSRAIEIEAQAADPDGDATTVRADLHPPPASDPNHVGFVMTGATSWTLTPDVAGHWEVVLTADDGFRQQTAKTLIFEVAADEPPCIAATSPAALPSSIYVLESRDPPRRFAVESVQDDLDPWPAPGSQLGFRWFVDGVEVGGHDLPDFTVDPADHLPGDTVELRVEIADRVSRTLPCAPDQAQCSIGGDMCLQRVTWKVAVR